MENKKCIVYIGYEIPTGDASAIRVFSNAKALKEYGFDVYILSFDKNLNNSFFTDEQEEIDGVHILRAKLPSYMSIDGIKYIFGIKKLLNAFKIIEQQNQISAIIAYNYPSFAFDKLVKYCKKNNKKIICDCTEWHSSVHYKGLIKMIKDVEINHGMKTAYKKSDGIIVISSVMEQYFSNNKTILIPPLQFEKRDFVEKKDREIQFIYAGIPGLDKDRLDLIIDSLIQFKEGYILNIYGISFDKYIEIFNINPEKAKQITNNTQIIFHGPVSHCQIVKALKMSDFSLIIRNKSRKNDYGFPTKFAESINNGVPVFVNDFSDILKYTKENELGIIAEDLLNLSKYFEEAINMSFEELNKLKKNCQKCELFMYKSYEEELGKFVENFYND